MKYLLREPYLLAEKCIKNKPQKCVLITRTNPNTGWEVNKKWGIQRNFLMKELESTCYDDRLSELKGQSYQLSNRKQSY